LSQPTFANYRQFFRFYLEEHSKPQTRILHVVGTVLGLAIAVLAVVLKHPLYILAWPVISYGFAWTSHFLVEHNRPATFGHPLWSLMGDFHMLGLMVTGRLTSAPTKE
jgi:hypothetical protein